MAEEITWTPADGSAPISLTDEVGGYAAEAGGTRGFRSVTYSFASRSLAGIDGERVDAVNVEANRPTLGLLVRADSETELRSRMRHLVHAMRPKLGPGALTVATEDGGRRTLTCYLESGLEGDEGDDAHLPGRWWKAALRFYAPTPWWEGPPVTLSLGLAAPTNFFPAPPFRLASSSVQGEFVVDLSDCDAPVYPVWEVSGPGSGLVLLNQTTGRSIEVNAPLFSGDVLVVDTRPGLQSVRKGDGTNLMASVGSDPALWPLVERVNRVSAQLIGATYQSRITATYRPRYAGA